jgi:HlyD family secretion protein
MADLGVVSWQDKRKKIIRNAGLIFVAVVILLTFFSKTINNFLLPEVECVTYAPGNLSKDITSEGEVTALDIETLYSTGNLKITDVMVKEGASVNKGDVLAVVNTEDVLFEIKSMELDLLKMEDDLQRYKDGFQAIDLYSYQEELNQSSKKLDKAKKDVDTEKSLYDSGTEPLKSLNDAEDILDSARTDYAAKQKLLAQKEADGKRGEADYQRTCKEKEAGIELKEIELDKKRMSIPEDGKIKSSVAGIVKTVSIEKGSVSNNGQSLFEIIGEETGLSIKWKVDFKAAGDIKENVGVSFSSSAPENFSFDGVVNDKKYLSKENMYEFTSEVPKDNDRLVIGQKVKVTIKKSKAYDMIVPSSSVIKEGVKECMYILKSRSSVLGEENYVAKIEVKVLESDDFNTAISGGGIAPEDKIISLSTKALMDNMQVKLR